MRVCYSGHQGQKGVPVAVVNMVSESLKTAERK